MVEPLAVGLHAATKARITPGDIAVVTGAGPIGMVTALAALAGGCSTVIMSDVQQPKLDLAASLGPIVPVNVATENLTEVVDTVTGVASEFRITGGGEPSGRVSFSFYRGAWRRG